MRKEFLDVQVEAEILLYIMQYEHGEKDVEILKEPSLRNKPRKENEWSKPEKIGVGGIIAVLFVILLVSTIGWMDVADRLSQKYVCPCFNYYLNESTGFYEAVRVVSCQCLNIDIEDAKACSSLSDTECRNVSNDKLVCDILIMENR